MGSSGCKASRSLMNPMPLRPGIVMSVRIRSGLNLESSLKASAGLELNAQAVRRF